MAFQTTSNFFPAIGTPGELATITPDPRVQSRICYSATVAQTFGFVFTESTAGDVQLDNTVVVGGTGVFAGILVQPKSAASFGTTAGGPLAPTLNLPDYAAGSLLTFGSVFVALPNASSLGDLVTYNTSTGAIADTFAATAAFTASQATTVLTVTAITAGNIGVGSVIRNEAGDILGTVLSLGTGTGGTGTYNMSRSATVSSAAMTANSQASVSTQRLIPNAKVDYIPVTGTNTGIITLTN